MSWLAAAALLPLAAWLWLLAAHGRFWRADQRLPEKPAEPSAWPPVVALVPARDEAETIGACVSGHLAQDYPGSFRLLVIDDESSDDTAERAEAAASTSDRPERFSLLAAPTREPGWVGKLWALESGRRHVEASGEAPIYWWLTDADIGHPPDTLRRLVAKAEQEQRALVSLMVRLWCRSFWERLLIPAFVFFFQKLYPFPRANDDRRRMAAAAGGCVLVRRETLAAAGGLAAMKGALIDDCTLAARVKPQALSEGRGIWVGLTDSSRSLRPYRGLGEIWRMVARSAYTQLHHNPLLLLGTLIGMAVLYLAPPLLLLAWPWHGDAPAALIGAAAWLAMAVAEAPTLRLYGRSPLEGLLLPAAGVLYSAMTFDSALRHWRGQGGRWKGRVGAGRQEA